VHGSAEHERPENRIVRDSEKLSWMRLFAAMSRSRPTSDGRYARSATLLSTDIALAPKAEAARIGLRRARSIHTPAASPNNSRGKFCAATSQPESELAEVGSHFSAIAWNRARDRVRDSFVDLR
jgi:hypothetical protein